MVWRELPPRYPIAPSHPVPVVEAPRLPFPVAPSSTTVLTQPACEQAGGLWASCGSPCHGHREDGVACIQICEPQCLCGGRAGWMCPATLVCTDYEPNAEAPGAVGVCRRVEKTSALPSIPSGMRCDPSRRVCVGLFSEDVLIENPLQVTGTMMGEGLVWNIVNGSGVVMASGTVTGDAPSAIDGRTPFSLRAFLSNPLLGASGTLVLSPMEARASSSLFLSAIWVQAKQGQTSHLYLSPRESGTDCGEVVPVDISFAKTAYPMEATVRRLLTPTVEDLKQGSTAIPLGTRLVSLSVKKGVVTVVFSRELASGGGGSCRVTRIRAQIEETLKRFSGVSSVVLSVEGKTPEETLQP